MQVFESKVLRKIYGHKTLDGGSDHTKVSTFAGRHGSFISQEMQDFSLGHRFEMV
jgi:hypothetical protein